MLVDRVAGMACFVEITFRVGLQQMKVEGTNHNFVLWFDIEHSFHLISEFGLND